MREVVIVDTSCLILLSKIDAFEILRALYKKVLTTHQVRDEYNQPLPDFIQIVKPSDSSLQQALGQILGKGESSVIALGFEVPKCLLIIDDRKAKRVAKSLDFSVTGTLGMLVKGKQAGVISRIKPLLDKLPQTDFRISDAVIAKILEIAGEN